MRYAEVVAQDHLYWLEMKSFVGGVDVGEVYHRDVLHNLLVVMTDFEVGEVSHQNFKIRAADSRVHPFILLQFTIRKQLVYKRFVNTAVRCARIEDDTDFYPRH